MTIRASYGASPVFTIRCSRCSTMPDTVCTIDVNARDRDDVARGLDRALLGVLLDQLQPLGVGRRPDVAQLLQNRERIVLEQRRELGVAVPGADDRRFVDVKRFAGDRRHERARLPQLDVALARLLRVVERVRVQERPDELPRDVLEAELEVRVLIDGVMAGVERQRADRVALRIGHFGRGDDARRITGARRGNRAVERRRRRGAQCDEGRPVASTSENYRLGGRVALVAPTPSRSVVSSWRDTASTPRDRSATAIDVIRSKNRTPSR